MPPRRRLLPAANRPRVLSPRQLHLRLRTAGAESGLRHPRRDFRAREGFPAAVPHKGVPTPRRADDRSRPPTWLRLRRRIRVRPEPHPRRPREHLAQEIVLGSSPSANHRKLLQRLTSSSAASGNERPLTGEPPPDPT